jgi:hypothetical protein
MLQCDSVRFRAGLLFPLLVACATSKPVDTSPHAAKIANLCTRVTCAQRYLSRVRIVDRKLVNEGKELTPQFTAIQSFDASAERGEIVFSAKRKDNFDIGLVAIEGSEIHWVPEDPADETDPVWAPRGNKVSFIVHTRAGDIVRTVHIPTAVQLSVPFAYATVRALAWEPAAERYFVVVNSPDASERIESVKYNGEAPRMEVPPEVRLDVALGPIGGGVLLRPATMRYGEKIPLVVWITDRPNQWNDARGVLMHKARVACAIMPSGPDDAFWAGVDATPWIDGKRVYVVGGHSARGIPVPHADVESLAASWIAQQLKDINGVR